MINRTEGRHAGAAKPIPFGRYAAIAILAALFTFLGTFFLGSITPANAATAPSWTQRTCSAERAYVAHPSVARLDVMITDSLHVPWHKPGSKYGLGSDVYGLGGDILAGKTQYVAKDEYYIVKDCA